MGSSCSGLIAENVMQHLETRALPHIQPEAWILYVDDTFV